MGFPNFGKVKTITLPFTGYEVEMPISEYKEKYGIDLRELLRLDTAHGLILLKDDNSLVLLNKLGVGLRTPVIQTNAYVHNSSDGQLNIVYLTISPETSDIVGEDGLIIYIEQNQEFTFDNMLVSGFNS